MESAVAAVGSSEVKPEIPVVSSGVTDVSAVFEGSLADVTSIVVEISDESVESAVVAVGSPEVVSETLAAFEERSVVERDTVLIIGIALKFFLYSVALFLKMPYIFFSAKVVSQSSQKTVFFYEKTNLRK